MDKNTIKLWNGKVYGIKVSDYGLENRYLDYYTLSQIVGSYILNNNIMEEIPYGWELVNVDVVDEDGECYDIYQWYIIDELGYRDLSRLTDEIVYYNDQLDLYLWGITHFGTSWDYVLTDVRIIEETEMEE